MTIIIIIIIVIYDILIIHSNNKCSSSNTNNTKNIDKSRDTINDINVTTTRKKLNEK